MVTDQLTYLKQHYQASQWQGGRESSRHLVKNFRFEGAELDGWTLHRQRLDDHEKPKAIRSLWRHEGSAETLLAIDIFECASIKMAHDQLLEALGNFETDAMKRQTRADALGDVAFAFDDRVALFARANIVVVIRNAGRDLVSVEPIARKLDALIARK